MSHLGQNGTVVISLSPVSARYFAAYGFRTEDIDIERLVHLAKDTGSVAFVLDEDPVRFVGLDFLDPIFLELKPPRIVESNRQS